ncbi:carboxylesterase family protein [Streptosporangiaceae bacterium NEAU-GS5]|nr:carboxylesterase family protein [Streptosporangiaceae bacterium NEAU-GS5]
MSAGPVVKTETGAVRGEIADGVASFKGIPYAAPPEGALRFRPPAAPKGWDGIRDAVAFGPAAPQLPPMPGLPPIWRPGDGLDCLQLNVWTPDLGAAGLPVMVWIYGGMWRHGATRMPHYDGAALARSGVVVVTVDYRVGFEGFGHLPGVPDNRGLRDQVAALEWVQREVAAFGGDPGRVTVFGQSAGAASVALHACSSRTAGLFRRAIAQSIPDGYRDPAEAGEITRIMAQAAGAEPTWEGFAALPPEAILAVQDAAGTPGSPYGPVIDGDLVTGPPWTAGPRPEIDLICGFTHEEYRGIGAVPQAPDLSALGLDTAAYRRDHPGRSDSELFVTMASDMLVRRPTVRTADAHAGAGGRTWLYDFAWRGPTLGAAHGIDVPFVFGTTGTRYAARFLGPAPSPDVAVLSERIQSAWVRFAATGDPGWPRYDLSERLMQIWNAPDDHLAACLTGLTAR